MRSFLRFVVLPIAIVAVLANLKDVGRYIALRSM